MSKAICPYCGKETEIHYEDDVDVFNECDLHEGWCSHCEKNFVFQCVVTITHNASKAPCLNGEECNWEPTTTIPKITTSIRCSSCGDEKEMSVEELEAYLKAKGERVTSRKQYVEEMDREREESK